MSIIISPDGELSYIGDLNDLQAFSENKAKTTDNGKIQVYRVLASPKEWTVDARVLEIMSRAREQGVVELTNDGGVLHSTDEPTVLLRNGDQLWYREGELHRDDGPAIQMGGDKLWFHDGVAIPEPVFGRVPCVTDEFPKSPLWHWVDGKGRLHCLTGPAAYGDDGTIIWAKDGKPHRTDGPAIMRNGLEIWLKEGKGRLHCLTGPAAYGDDGTIIWAKDGKPHRTDGPAIMRNGLEIWLKEGKRHRTDGPAFLSPFYSIWYKRGVIHRTDGPAYETESLSQWFYNGEPHRMDGPAKITKNASGEVILEEWYRRGKLCREDGPAKIKYAFGAPLKESWYRHGNPHREGGPAITCYAEGKVQLEKWMDWGMLHRGDGPAVIDHCHGEERYYRHGRELNLLSSLPIRIGTWWKSRKK